MSTFDATKYKKLGDDLAEEISTHIDNSNNFFFVPIPSKLLITKKQFNSLLKSDDLDDMYQLNVITEEPERSKEKMFFTKKGFVMEVVVE